MASVLRPRTALPRLGASTTSPSLRRIASPFSALPYTQAQRRHVSGPYGYTQSKSLLFSSFGEPTDVLSLHTHSISPSLPSGSVLLRTLAAPVNPADVNTIQGTYGVKPPFTPHLLGAPQPSVIPGNEACFEVTAIGPNVSGFSRGDWVIPASTGFGTFRTHALVENAEKSLFNITSGDPSKKDGLTPVQVATVSVNPCSAYRMLKDYVDLVKLSIESYQKGNDVTGGAWFLQNGANSGVGRAAIQLGKLWGLRSINIIRERSTPEQTESLKQELRDLGATVVFTETEFLDRSFRDRLAELTNQGKEPIMLGMNCVGGKSASAVVKALSQKGVMVTYGGMSRQSFPFPTGPQIFKRLRFEGFWLSPWGNENPAEKKKTIEEVLQLMREKKFQEAPVQEVTWDWDTEEKTLKEAVQGTLEGFRSGKGVFVFGET
ncbi:mitochondrial putative trans-2-enoyl-CoA reductase [Podospora australis]|uniref:enoyl-[acyl-carrier-protein] reductase n=1 Tax=Podospora australis TaxID=1536484 RepID=A0AAN6WRP5_9PEZI|nr:mitochondrial putative trans-2-enoyl-CoA reductase [Podospora australis]